jgi:EmrB/QacA subfamily drug resistance transporter
VAVTSNRWVSGTSHPRRWAILAVVLAVEVMDLLDGTVVSVAIPSIKSDLSASSGAVQWIVGGYSLAFAMGLVTGGRLGDIVGHRRTFLFGSAGFVLASMVCGFAPSTGWLIVARLVQGLAGAIAVPQGFGILRSVFAPDEQQKAFALFGPVIGLSAVLGPIIGGLLVDSGLFGQTWRTVFFVNLPVGLAACIGAYFLLPESRSEHPPRLDLVGTVLVSAAAGLLVYPLIQGREAGWPWWTWACFAASAVTITAFGAWIRARERAGADPLVTPSLFAKRAFNSGLGVMFVFFGGMSGVLLAFTLYLQLGQHFSAIHAGLTLAPWSFGLALGATLSGAVLGPKFGRLTLQAGTAVVGIGVALVLWAVHTHPLTSTTWWLLGPLAVWGIGMGLFVAPAFDIIIAGVTDEESGSASGLLNASQQLAGAVGVAVLGTIFFGVLGSRGYASAFERVLTIEIGLTVLIVLVSPLLPRRVRETSPEQEPELIGASPAA